MGGYLTLARFRQLTLMPGSFVDEIETVDPGWVDTQLTVESARINSRLAKRYAVPFGEPVPLAIEAWLTKIVTWNAYLKRGEDPTDKQSAEYRAQAEGAWMEIKEAADSDLGLFDLPLRSDNDLSAIARGSPRAYSEQSPYVWQDQQAQTAKREDENRLGDFYPLTDINGKPYTP